MRRNSFTIIILIFIIVFLTFSQSLFAQNKDSIQKSDYSLVWPGILPDSKFYKLKVLRNKIIYKIIISPVKKVEFDLLMADKTIYASKLLVERGQIELAKETVLKGENYYSMLVQDYNRALLEGKHIPRLLDDKITQAVIKHQEIFRELRERVGKKDGETFQVVDNFSRINFNFILGLRKSDN